jgi:hypothetical protein
MQIKINEIWSSERGVDEFRSLLGRYSVSTCTHLPIWLNSYQSKPPKIPKDMHPWLRSIRCLNPRAAQSVIVAELVKV